MGSCAAASKYFAALLRPSLRKKSPPRPCSLCARSVGFTSLRKQTRRRSMRLSGKLRLPPQGCSRNSLFELARAQGLASKETTTRIAATSVNVGRPAEPASAPVLPRPQSRGRPARASIRCGRRTRRSPCSAPHACGPCPPGTLRRSLVPVVDALPDLSGQSLLDISLAVQGARDFYRLLREVINNQVMRKQPRT